MAIFRGRGQLLARVAGMSTAVIVGVFLAALPAEAATVRSPTVYDFEHEPGYFNGVNGYTESDNRSSVPNFSKPAVLHAPTGAKVKVSYDYYTFRSGKVSAAKFGLQRQSGKKWITVKGAKFVTAKRHGRGVYTVTTTIPKVTVTASRATRTVTYRLVTKTVHTKTRWTIGGDKSITSKIVYENQARYTGLQADVYNALKNYCPDATVKTMEFNADFPDAPDTIVGEYSFGGYRILVDDDIAKIGGAQLVASVALHECGHWHQFWNYGANAKSFNVMKTAMAKVFTDDSNPDGSTTTGTGFEGGNAFVAYEHAADCAAESVYADDLHGYGGYCNQTELAAGRNLMFGRRI